MLLLQALQYCSKPQYVLRQDQGLCDSIRRWENISDQIVILDQRIAAHVEADIVWRLVGNHRYNSEIAVKKQILSIVQSSTECMYRHINGSGVMKTSRCGKIGKSDTSSFSSSIDSNGKQSNDLVGQCFCIILRFTKRLPSIVIFIYLTHSYRQ